MATKANFAQKFDAEFQLSHGLSNNL